MSFLPLNPTHAIMYVRVGVEFDPPLSAETMAAISQLHPRFKNDFPRKSERHSVHIEFGAGAVPVVSKDELPIGINFERLSPDGEAERLLEITPNSMVIQRTDYSGWSSIWGETSKLFSDLFSVIPHNNLCKGLALQYVDRFDWKANLKDFNIAELINEGTSFLPQSAFKANNIWHNHHGLFNKRSSPVPHNFLNNIMVDVIDIANDSNEQERQVQIALVHKVTLLNVIELEKLIDHHDLASQFFNIMHAMDKDILRDLLTPAMCTRIGLDERTSP